MALETTLVTIRASDGVERPAWFVQRVRGPSVRPGVLLVHGGMGEASVETLRDFASSPCFNGARLAEAGYAVLVSDYRHRSHVAGEVDDTVAAYEWLANRPGVDGRHVAMIGTSHGAICALLAAMQTQPACIVAEEGATDLLWGYQNLMNRIHAARSAAPDAPLSQYLQQDLELWTELCDRLGGTPYDIPQTFEAASVHRRASAISAPVLILTGDHEYAPSCLRMFVSLREAGREASLQVCRDATHAFWWERLPIPATAAADDAIYGFLASHLGA